MDRQIVYPGQVPLETDLLNTNRNVMVALGMLAQDLWGTSTVVSGFTCTPNSPAAMNVLLNPGRVYTLTNLDGTAYSSLAADTTHQIMKQGIQLNAVTLSCPAPATVGYSINYLIEVAYQDIDASGVTLPYYNSNNPSQAYSGPNNTGSTQFTVRQGAVVAIAKAGIAATTGTQTTPAADAGYVGLFVVTVAYGASSITAGNISQLSSAPFIAAIDGKLRANLADQTTAANGAGLLGFNAALSYPAGTLGYQEVLAQVRGGYTDYLAKAVANLYAGNALTIEFYGDSTMYGADPQNSYNQVPNPSPNECQNLLNTYYNNTAATCTNKGISGTTLNQMLLGTDGSGSTFATKMTVSPASIVYCNHGINDAVGSGVSTTADVYKANLIQFVQLVRMAGKAPVLVTPVTQLPYGGIGTRARAETLKLFCGIMRQVAQQYAVPLVDNFAFLEKMLASGKYTPLQLIPDGCHPAAAYYPQLGRNMAIPLVQHVRAISGPDQFYSLAEASALSTNELSQSDASSRLGYNITSGLTATESLRALVLVGEPKLDIYMAGIAWANGASTFSLNVDGSTVASAFSQQASAFTGATGFIHDQEICIVENADPGLHYIALPTASAGYGCGLNYFRSRQAFWSNPMIRGSGQSSQENYRRLLLQNFQMASSATNAVTLVPDFPTTRLLRNLDIEFNAQLSKQSGVVLHGLTFGTLSGPGSALPGITVGLNASGYLTVWEQNGPSSQASSVLGAVDLSTASHLFYIHASSGRFGTIQVYVDSTLIGTYTCTMPWWGGFLGFWNQTPANQPIITNLYQTMRL